MTENVTQPEYWKRCSSCKKEIPFGGVYQRCSVSTCNSKKLGLVFCSIPCWDAHLGFANHRDSSALEERAPTLNQFLQQQKTSEDVMSESESKRVIVRPQLSDTASGVTNVELMEVDTLVVVSKVKKLIRDQSDFNTSQCAVDALTQIVVKECLKAIESAKTNGRKTVMGRDF